jgi:single-strand DNA-binding protein
LGIDIFSEGFFIFTYLKGENTMSYLNSVTLIGNLGRDPEVLTNTEKSCFVRLNIATTKKYRNRAGEIIENTQWHTVYVNNGAARYAANFIKKGAKVLVEGELDTKIWQNKKGDAVYSTSVYARSIRTLIHKNFVEEVEAHEEGASEAAINADSNNNSAYEEAMEYLEKKLPELAQKRSERNAS